MRKERGGSRRLQIQRNGMPPQQNRYTAYLKRVIDGDTVVVQIDLGFGVLITRHVRLQNTDCPEMNGHINGWHARNDTAEWWTHNNNTATIITDHQTDHYGRTLADFEDHRGRTLSNYLNHRHCNPREIP